VKLAPPKVQNAGGIIEAPAMAVPICYGKVVQVGAKVPLHGVNAGDVVCFDRAAGEPLAGPLPMFLKTLFPHQTYQELP
jgi:hypothetical protein